MPFLSGDSEVLNSYFKEAPLAKKKKPELGKFAFFKTNS